MKKIYNVGITWGCFDGMTEAHLAILKYATSHCKFLIVGVSDDDYIIENKKQKPILSWGARVQILERFSDKVVPQSKYFTKAFAVLAYSPDVVFVGAEYKDKNWEGKNLGLPIEYIEHDKTIHSADLRHL